MHFHIRNIICLVLLVAVINRATPRVHHAAYNTPYHRICHELEFLKKEFDHTKLIPLSSQKAQRIAPTLYSYVHDNTRQLARKAHLPVPDICISCNPGDYLYNAALRLRLLTYPGAQGKTIIKRLKSTLIIGEELIKLFLQSRKTMTLIQESIAHELGHLHYNHTTHGFAQEYEADIFSLSLLDNPTQALTNLDLVQLAHTLHYCLIRKKHTISGMTDETMRTITRMIAPALVEAVPGLGLLGLATTHNQFKSLVNLAVSQGIDDFKNTVKAPDTEEISLCIYNQLKRICLEKSSKIASVEQKPTKNQAFRHPAHGLRRAYLQHALSTL